MPDATAIDDLVATFTMIGDTRMAGIPVVNQALSVAATEPVETDHGLFTVLLTPWFINAVLMPDANDVPIRTGEKRSFDLPGGRFEFIRSHEEALGGFWMCSLFSPVLEFDDMETALATAEAAAEAMLQPAETEEPVDEGMEAIWRGEWPDAEPADAPEAADTQPAGPVSRRAFLTARRPAEQGEDAA